MPHIFLRIFLIILISFVQFACIHQVTHDVCFLAKSLPFRMRQLVSWDIESVFDNKFKVLKLIHSPTEFFGLAGLDIFSREFSGNQKLKKSGFAGGSWT